MQGQKDITFNPSSLDYLEKFKRKNFSKLFYTVFLEIFQLLMDKYITECVKFLLRMDYVNDV